MVYNLEKLDPSVPRVLYFWVFTDYVFHYQFMLLISFIACKFSSIPFFCSFSFLLLLM